MKGRFALAAILTLSTICRGQTPPAVRAPEPWRDWTRVTDLRRNTEVRVETGNPKRDLRGILAAADAEGLTIDLAGPAGSLTIPRANVTKVRRPTRSMRRGAQIGAVGGAVVWAILVSRPGTDLTASGQAVLIGFGAGLGALIGLGAGAVDRYRLVYHAPAK